MPSLRPPSHAQRAYARTTFAPIFFLGGGWIFLGGDKTNIKYTKKNG